MTDPGKATRQVHLRPSEPAGYQPAVGTAPWLTVAVTQTVGKENR
jgi:hypothetical protein